MKNWLIGAVVIALVGSTLPSEAEARRLGGGKSSGMQRSMPARTAPDATPAKPAAPAQQAAPAAPTAGAAPAAAAPKRSWMGPLAGLAAGLGIAALMSHLGMGEAFGNFLLLALLAVAGIALITFVMRRFGAARSPAWAGAPTGASAGGSAGGNVSSLNATLRQQPLAQERTAFDAPPAAHNGLADTLPAADQPGLAPAAAPLAKVFVPAAFDSEGFSRTAKMIFIRLQTANDTADLDDLRRFTTPELFAAIRLEIQERGATPQQTDVLKVDAEVLDVTQETDRQVVSVRFTGQVVEDKGAKPADFHEVWHLVKPHDDSRPWAIAGIEQMH